MAASEQRERVIPKGAILFRQGDAGNEMFVISEGRIRLTIGSGGHEKEVGVFGTGEFFGELSLLSGEARTATAQAAEDTKLLVIGRDVFAMMVQDDLEIVFRMLNIQGRRLSLTNQPIQELTRRLGRIRVVAHCIQQRLQTVGGMPCAVDAEQLAAELTMSAEAVRATLEEIAERGAGAWQGRQWTMPADQPLHTLIDMLCTYADNTGA